MRSITSIGTSTQICAIIGNPVQHSLSPAIHNAAFQELDLDFVYVAHRVEDVKNAIAGMRALENFRAMSVTIPHKVEVMKYLDSVNKVDREIGAINTVINDLGTLRGMGTDGPGALNAILSAGINMDKINVLMLGSGGAARMIAFTLVHQTGLGHLAILDIDKAMLDALAGDLILQGEIPIHANLLNDNTLAENMETADLIIHCTPMGMHPRQDVSLIAPELFRQEQTVFDIVYTPMETKLLKDAKSKGLQVISGVEMFINQAVLQFEQFTGKTAPVDVMRRVVMEHLKS